MAIQYFIPFSVSVEKFPWTWCVPCWNVSTCAKTRSLLRRTDCILHGLTLLVGFVGRNPYIHSSLKLLECLLSQCTCVWACSQHIWVIHGWNNPFCRSVDLELSSCLYRGPGGPPSYGIWVPKQKTGCPAESLAGGQDEVGAGCIRQRWNWAGHKSTVMVLSTQC